MGKRSPHEASAEESRPSLHHECCTAGRLMLSSTRSLKPKHIRILRAARLAQRHAVATGMNRSHNRPMFRRRMALDQQEEQTMRQLIRLAIPRAIRAAALVAAALLTSPTYAADADWTEVGKALGKSGSEMPGGVYRVGLPRSDRKVSLD